MDMKLVRLKEATNSTYCVVVHALAVRQALVFWFGLRRVFGRRSHFVNRPLQMPYVAFLSTCSSLCSVRVSIVVINFDRFAAGLHESL